MKVVHGNGCLFRRTLTVYDELATLSDEQCQAITLHVLNEIPTSNMAMIMRKESLYLEPINVIVAERFERYDQVLRSGSQLSKACYRHFFSG